MMRITFFSSAVVAAMGIAILMLPAHADAGVLDMWTTPVNLTTSNTAAYQPASQFAANIYDLSVGGPDPAVYGIVSRTVTVLQPVSSPSYPGAPYAESFTATVGSEQRLFFNTYSPASPSNGQLAIEYQFGISGGVAASQVDLSVANNGATAFNIAMFTEKAGTASWALADFDPFAPNTPSTAYRFSTNTNDNISGLLIIYNPRNDLLSGYSFVDSSGNPLLYTSLPFAINGDSVQGDVSGISTSVPEPSSMVLGFIGIGLSVVVYRKRNQS